MRITIPFDGSHKLAGGQTKTQTEFKMDVLSVFLEALAISTRACTLKISELKDFFEY
jgi:hypothetical protein